MKIERKQNDIVNHGDGDKRNKVIIVFIVLVISIIAIVMFKNRIPNYLKTTKAINNSVERFKDKDSEFAIFYPNDEILEINMDTIVENIKMDLISKELLKDNYKVENQLFIVDDRYYSMKFDLTSENNTVNDSYIYLYDNHMQENIKLNEILSLSIKTKISNDLRYYYKNNHVNDDFAYTNDFYEQTQINQAIYNNIYINNECLILYINPNQLGNDEMIEIKYNLSDVVSDLNLELSIESSGVILENNRYIDPNRKMVAFTFDDGPINENTTIAIETLQKFDAGATFFMQGYLMRNNHELILRMIKDGFEIGSHSYSHPKITKIRSEGDLEYQLNENQRILDEITNSSYQINLFRPPYGAYNDKVLQASNDAFIMWSLDTLDWKSKDEQLIYDAIINNVVDGDIILLHDLHLITVKSLEKIMVELVNMGYQIVSFSEMMEAKNIEVLEQNVYYSAK